MTEADVAKFEALRPRLFGIAYRMLGTVSDAEDVLQDAYLRYASAGDADIRSLEAFLVTVVTRLCLDRIKSAQAQREVYVGPWLPEPLLTDRPPELSDPAERMADLDSISLAFVLLLQSLSPEERAVFLLREVFDYDYAEIAGFLGKGEAACRQLFSRAKRRVAEHRPRIASTPEEHRRVLTQFMQAMASGDLSGLMQLMASDVASYSDGGGKAAAATRPLFGADRVARFLVGLATQGVQWSAEVVVANGRESVMIRAAGQTPTFLTLDVVDGRVQAVFFVRNPDKLGRLDRNRIP